HGPFDGVIVMSLRRLGLAPLREFRRAGVPSVVTVNDDWPVAYALPASMPRWRRMIEQILSAPKILQRADVEKVVYLSHAVRKVVERAGAPFPDWTQQFQGVDRRRFTPAPTRTQSRDRRRVLFSGRLHPSKGPEFVIDALAALREQGRDVELVFAGAAHDAAYDAALRARAERRGVAAFIQWLGHVDREALPAVYQSADVCVFISTLAHEGQGLTYLEAMACGVPVVAWPSGGAAEFLDQFPVARRAGALTGSALAADIGALLDHPEDAARLRADALQMIEQHASLDVYVGALESAIA
ncbi:MAG: glycosyltransferase family 4 protein, partial [Acidobacteriota bacterium]